MGNFLIPEKPEYSESLRKLEVTDPAHADLFNEMFGQLLENDAYFKKEIGELPGTEYVNTIVQQQVQDAVSDLTIYESKTVTVPVTAWTGSGPYTAQVSVEGITGDDAEILEIFLDYSATLEQKTAWAAAGVQTADNIEGAVVLEALGEKPEIDIPIHILKRGGSSTGGSPIACDCTAITEQQVEAIVDGTYTPEESTSSVCGCEPLTAGEIIEIAEE